MEDEIVFSPFGVVRKKDLERQLMVRAEGEVFHFASPWFQKRYKGHVYFSAPLKQSKSSLRVQPFIHVDLHCIKGVQADLYELKGVHRTWREKFSKGIRSPEIPMQCAYYEQLLVNAYLDPDYTVLFGGRYISRGRQEAESYTFNYMVSLGAYKKAKEASCINLLEELGYGLFVAREYDDCVEVTPPTIHKLDRATAEQRKNIVEEKLRYYGKIQ